MTLGPADSVLLAPLVLQAAILLFCSVVQSTVGFAFTLFSNALLLMTGLPLPQTVMVSLLGSSLQRLLMASRMRKHVEWRELWPLIAVCVACLPVGIWILRLVSRQSLDLARGIIGSLILAALILQWLWKVKPRDVLARGWGLVAAACSGVLAGFANIGGPPIILWIHAHNWSNEKSRVTLPALSLPLVPFQIAMLLAAFGRQILPSLAQVAVLAPTIVAGTAIGMALGHRLSIPRLRLVTYVLLIITCLTCILGPVLRACHP